MWRVPCPKTADPAASATARAPPPSAARPPDRGPAPRPRPGHRGVPGIQPGSGLHVGTAGRHVRRSSFCYRQHVLHKQSLGAGAVHRPGPTGPGRTCAAFPASGTVPGHWAWCVRNTIGPVRGGNEQSGTVSTAGPAAAPVTVSAVSRVNGPQKMARRPNTCFYLVAEQLMALVHGSRLADHRAVAPSSAKPGSARLARSATSSTAAQRPGSFGPGSGMANGPSQLQHRDAWRLPAPARPPPRPDPGRCPAPPARPRRPPGTPPPRPAGPSPPRPAWSPSPAGTCPAARRPHPPQPTGPTKIVSAGKGPGRHQTPGQASIPGQQRPRTAPPM